MYPQSLLRTNEKTKLKKMRDAEEYITMYLNELRRKLVSALEFNGTENGLTKS